MDEGGFLAPAVSATESGDNLPLLAERTDVFSGAKTPSPGKVDALLKDVMPLRRDGRPA